MPPTLALVIPSVALVGLAVWQATRKSAYYVKGYRAAKDAVKAFGSEVWKAAKQKGTGVDAVEAYKTAMKKIVSHAPIKPLEDEISHRQKSVDKKDSEVAAALALKTKERESCLSAVDAGSIKTRIVEMNEAALGAIAGVEKNLLSARNELQLRDEEAKGSKGQRRDLWKQLLESKVVVWAWVQANRATGSLNAWLKRLPDDFAPFVKWAFVLAILAGDCALGYFFGESTVTKTTSAGQRDTLKYIFAFTATIFSIVLAIIVHLTDEALRPKRNGAAMSESMKRWLRGVLAVVIFLPGAIALVVRIALIASWKQQTGPVRALVTMLCLLVTAAVVHYIYEFKIKPGAPDYNARFRPLLTYVVGFPLAPIGLVVAIVLFVIGICEYVLRKIGVLISFALAAREVRPAARDEIVQKVAGLEGKLEEYRRNIVPVESTMSLQLDRARDICLRQFDEVLRQIQGQRAELEKEREAIQLLIADPKLRDFYTGVEDGLVREFSFT